MSLKITEYTPNQNNSLRTEVKQMFKDFWSSRELAQRLFLRDKKAEYRQSLLGVLWAFITPCVNALVWIFLTASGAVNIQTEQLPYPLFVFIGTMLWSIFTDSVNMPLNATNEAKALISKINFPKEAILISGFYKILFNALIKITIVILALFVFQINPGFYFLEGFLMVLFLMSFGIALGLLITPIGMLYKDIGRAIPLGLSFLMYATPVVYQEMKNPILAKFININPLTSIINSTRNLLTGYIWDQPMYLAAIGIGTLIVTLIGWVFYRVSIPIIIERM